MKGYEIVARNVRTKRGELDVIAKRGGMWVIVEVKARDSVEEGLLAVTKYQQGRIVKGFELWLWEEGLRGRERGDVSMRYDVMVVLRGLRFHHEKDAFRVDD